MAGNTLVLVHNTGGCGIDGLASKIDVENLTMTDTVANHAAVPIAKKGPKHGLPQRPYMGRNDGLLSEIMAGSKPRLDPRGTAGALRWDTPGAMNGSEGTWELVIDTNQNRILHLEFCQMTVEVRISPGEPLAGQLLYRVSEYSFMFQVADHAEAHRRAGSEGVTSLVADTLQLEVGVETGQLLFAWGYLPASSWSRVVLERPRFVPGVLELKALDDLEPGASLSISRGADWKAEFDRSIGWLRVATLGAASDAAVQIADGVVIGVREDEIAEIWLRPSVVD